MLESELYNSENSDHAGGGRAAGELNPPAPSVPAAVFQPPPVRPEAEPAATQPSVSSRPAVSSRSAAPSANGDATGDGGGDGDGDDDGTGAGGRRRRRRPSRSRTRTGED